MRIQFQLTLEQHRFELQESIHIQIFFNKYHSPLHWMNLRMQNPGCREPTLELEYGVPMAFDIHLGSWNQYPTVTREDSSLNEIN